jgi:hypothetical protein
MAYDRAEADLRSVWNPRCEKLTDHRPSDLRRHRLGTGWRGPSASPLSEAEDDGRLPGVEVSSLYGPLSQSPITGRSPGAPKEAMTRSAP